MTAYLLYQTFLTDNLQDHYMDLVTQKPKVSLMTKQSSERLKRLHRQILSSEYSLKDPSDPRVFQEIETELSDVFSKPIQLQVKVMESAAPRLYVLNNEVYLS